MDKKTNHIARISVVMCTFNGEKFLREQMDSILNQDYPLHEIIVQDDGSTDGTWALLEDYRSKHPELIKLFRNEERLGFNRNFHTAFLRATGEFIAISDQDDIWLPQKVARQVEAIGECDLCYSEKYEFWNEDLSHVTQTNYFTAPLYALLGNSLAGHTMLVRTDFVRQIEHWECCIVYDWWLTIHANLGRGIVRIAEPLNYHRKHYASATTRNYKTGRWQAVEHATWQPYVQGFFNFRRMQKLQSFRDFYTCFSQSIEVPRFPAEAKMVHLLLSRNPFNTLRLCCLCAHHYRETYKSSPNLLKWRIRAFFAPLITAYYQDKFDRYKY